MATKKTVKLINAWNITYNNIRKGEIVNVSEDFVSKYERKGFVKHSEYFKGIEQKRKAEENAEKEKEKAKKKKQEEQKKRDDEQAKLDKDAEKRKNDGENNEEEDDETEIDDEEESEEWDNEETEEIDDPLKEDADLEEENNEDEEEQEIEEIKIDLENGTIADFQAFTKKYEIKVGWRKRKHFVKAIEDFIAEQSK